MEDFKIRKHIRCKDEGVNDYIESLESYILNLKASNTNRLIFKLDELNGVIADDVQKIIDGDATTTKEIVNPITEKVDIQVISNLAVLTDDKDNKTFDRVMTLYGKLKDLKETANIVKAMIPELEDIKEDIKKPKLKIDMGTNPFEQIQKAVSNKK